MNDRERVTAALVHEQPDRVPYDVGFTAQAHQKMVEYTGDPDFAGKIGSALVMIGPTPPDAWREVRPDVWRDEFGVEWDRSREKDIGVVANRVVDEGNVEDHPLPDPRTPQRFAHVRDILHTHPDRFRVMNLGFSLFERAWTMTGMEHLLMAMLTDPPFVNRLLDRILDYNLAVIEESCRFDIDAMMFGDDWGQQRGLIMGYDAWVNYIKPRIRRMYGAVRDHGKFVMIHSCGKVDSVFGDLAECGLHSFNPFQPEVMDVYEMKRRFGDRLAFHGGISTQRTLPRASADETRAEVQRLLSEIGRGGGYICAPAHAIPGDAKPENIAAMIEILQNQ